MAIVLYCTAQFPHGPGGEPVVVTEFEALRVALITDGRLTPAPGESYPAITSEADAERLRMMLKLHTAPNGPPVSWQPNDAGLKDYQHLGSVVSASHEIRWHPVCGVCGAPVKEIK